MTTQKQAAANAENAKLSTGPRTEEGHEASAKNALKHGLSAKKYLTPDEDLAEFEEFLADAKKTYRSANRQEDELVFEITVTLWRFRRLARAERSAYSAAPLEQLASLSSQIIRQLAIHEASIRRTLLMFERLLENRQAARRRCQAEEEAFDRGRMSKEEFEQIVRPRPNERVVTI